MLELAVHKLAVVGERTPIKVDRFRRISNLTQEVIVTREVGDVDDHDDRRGLAVVSGILPDVAQGESQFLIFPTGGKPS